ncbi:E2F-associated phosphoprotein isoform X2 [Antechinus flavipes]|uniref:E2F-associated phosphoprotein isoform X2 n=1 Tax=Antechinus flavipes TaxID=38775 RepID=UPI002235A76E|nr:E2F-associated phosphoprotein isoform X2 [Antechinus flavipes]
MNRPCEDDDPYIVEEPSDEEPALSSSEDEVDVLLHGTPDQKRKLIRECLTGESESSSEDEFEKEMEAELNSTIKTMEDKLSSLETGSSLGTGKISTVLPNYYNDIYFESDSEDEDTEISQVKKKKKQYRIPTNDELLYDPEKDNRDQAWVDAQRRGHEYYKTQYRAMFVMNCSVNREEVLRYKSPMNKKKRWGHKKMKSDDEDDSTVQPENVEVYHPVKCTECSTEVAVFDKNEIFHFFNVLASHT